MGKGRPYGLCSDLHAHDWSAFASLDADGRNTRLMDIIHELERCCRETRNAGGKCVVIAGDVFHVRGEVSPSVFNPVRDCLLREITNGMCFLGIPGNHDLAGRASDELTSAVKMLAHPSGVMFEHTPFWGGNSTNIALVPWHPTPVEYLDAIESMTARVDDPANCDLVIHLGIDGTLARRPAHGADATRLKSFGFRRVFSGHYHHAKDFGDGVFSIGALTHQTWVDVGTRAGFWVVYPDHEQFFASHAPSFIELTGEEDPDDLLLIVDGHFVRARVGHASPVAIRLWRENLLDMGARGVIIEAVPETAEHRREGVSAKSINSLETSVSSYVSERGMPAEVGSLCLEILREAQA